MAKHATKQQLENLIDLLKKISAENDLAKKKGLFSRADETLREIDGTSVFTAVLMFKWSGAPSVEDLDEAYEILKNAIDHYTALGPPPAAPMFKKNRL